jgi:hypothetical protein
MSPQHAISAGYENLQWQPIVPELGTDSPQVSILRVDPKTQATQLLIRMPKRMHVPMHWHSANETHTMIKGTMVFEHEGPAPRLWSPSRRRFGSSNGGVAARHAGRCGVGEVVHVLDPLAYAVSLSIIIAACLVAASIPAARAARLDPTQTLRQE